jgi:hypothetical protein
MPLRKKLATAEKGGYMSPNSYLDSAKNRQSLASTAPLNWPTILFFTVFHGIAGLAITLILMLRKPDWPGGKLM